MNPITAHALTAFELKTTGPERAAMLLTDTTGATTGFAVGPEGLGVVLRSLLALAASWADKPEFQAEMTKGGNALPASKLAIGRGRDLGETALSLQVGSFTMTFVLPLDELVGAVAGLKDQIEIEKSPGAR